MLDSRVAPGQSAKLKKKKRNLPGGGSQLHVCARTHARVLSPLCCWCCLFFALCFFFVVLTSADACKDAAPAVEFGERERTGFHAFVVRLLLLAVHRGKPNPSLLPSRSHTPSLPPSPGLPSSLPAPTGATPFYLVFFFVSVSWTRAFWRTLDPRPSKESRGGGGAGKVSHFNPLRQGWSCTSACSCVFVFGVLVFCV